MYDRGEISDNNNLEDNDDNNNNSEDNDDNNLEDNEDDDDNVECLRVTDTGTCASARRTSATLRRSRHCLLPSLPCFLFGLSSDDPPLSCEYCLCFNSHLRVKCLPLMTLFFIVISSPSGSTNVEQMTQ